MGGFLNKMRKNADRFNGVTEEELYSKTLEDRIDFNLDIVFVSGVFFLLCFSISFKLIAVVVSG